MSLDLNNFTTEEQVFFDALESTGMPVTDTEIKAELQQLADDAHLTISNPSKYSAFWCFCAEAIIKPMQYLTAFLIKNVMPNFYVKTASGMQLDIIAWTYDIERKPAAKAQGNLLFSRGDTTQQLLIPAGTRVRTIPINGNIYRMITLDDAVMDAGVSSLEVACEAENSGDGYNLGTTYYSIMDSDVPGITAVTNEEGYLTSLGSDLEPDEQLRLRLRNQFSAVGDWHTDAKYKAMISEQTGFRIDRIFFVHETSRDPGSADAYILFDASAPDVESADIVNAVKEYIKDGGNHGHGDDLDVKAITYIPNDISVTVVFSSSVTDSSALLTNIEQFIRCAFRENSDYEDDVTQTWPFSRFSFSKLGKELHTYFPEIEALTWGQADIESDIEVPKIGTLTVSEAV